MDAVRCLVDSDEARPTNIGTDELVTIAELVGVIAGVAGKQVSITEAPGPLGVTARNFGHDRVAALGWKPEHSLRAGITKTYAWVKAQLDAEPPR